MDVFSWKPTAKRLSPNEVDVIMERLIMSRAVDPSHVPMNQPTSPDSPELGLHRAILFDAVQCVVRHHDSRSRIRSAEVRSACRWIESNDESYFLSFVPICHRFNIEPEWIRRLVCEFIQRDHTAVDAAAAA